MTMISSENKLIVIEGADRVGKTTQVGMLTEALGEHPVSFGKFPLAGSFFGKVVYESLRGEHGNFLELSPYLAALPFMVEQAAAQEELARMLTGGHVILDRYTPSNLAHQAAKLPPAERPALVRYIEEGTYGQLHAIRPDVVIVLDMPIEMSKRIACARGREDQHESDTGYQRNVRHVYRDLARSRSGWHLIGCVHRGDPLSPDDVHEKIMDILMPVFGEVSARPVGVLTAGKQR